MKKRIECVVTGEVQGVFFRDFVRDAAEALGISGFVKNNPDGTVTAVGEGEEEKLKIFSENIKKGTEYSKITGIDVKWSEETDEFPAFEIRF